MGERGAFSIASSDAPRAMLRAALAMCALGVPLAAETHVLVAAGLGGTPEYEAAFLEHAEAATRAAQAAGNVVTLRSGAEARADALREALATLAGTLGEADRLVLQLIGHGTFDDEHYRFNVPGPDPTAADLAAWLAPIDAERQLVIVATSASGAALAPLRREGRTIIAATRDGGERNAVHFPVAWAEALTAEAADTNKDKRIDADEAFRFASQAVAAYYEAGGRIATEHPRLEGSATHFVLAAGSAPAVAATPLARQRAALLADIDALRASKDAQREDDYFARLQTLLLELAAVERAIDRESTPEHGADSP